MYASVYTDLSQYRSSINLTKDAEMSERCTHDNYKFVLKFGETWSSISPKFLRLSAYSNS